MDDQPAIQSRSLVLRSFAFRILAICLGLLPFVLLELALTLLAWQPAALTHDPYVGFNNPRPLFVSDGEHFKTANDRQPLFRPEQFLAEKPENEFRIFCVGGSTVQGRPFAIETAFSTWLEIQLNHLAPQKNWNAINCGGVSYASYRLVPIIEEISNYEPDLIVLYTGHNEFLEDRTYDAIKSTSPWVSKAHAKLSNLKTYTLMRQLFIESPTPQPEILPDEVEARLDYKNGLDKYTYSPDWKTKVTNHFGLNFERMIQFIQKENIPLIVINPVSNLKDCSPFKSYESSDESIEKLLESIAKKPLDLQISELKNLEARYPESAQVMFERGMALLEFGNMASAKDCLIRAKDLDICPLRMLEPMHEIVLRVSEHYQVELIDARKTFAEESPNQIIGKELLVDHVHPSIYGHQQIANLIVDKMRAMNLVELKFDKSIDDSVGELFEAHLESLPYMYFELAKDRLNGLKRWAEGRVTKERAPQQEPSR